jgi:hypothetical protein
VFLGCRAIRDPEVTEFLSQQQFDINSINLNYDILNQLKSTTVNWLNNSTNLHIKGHEEYEFLSMPGFNSTLKEFIMRNTGKRVRIQRGEYWYTTELLDYHKRGWWSFFDEGELEYNDCVVISAPFYGNMELPSFDFLDTCDKLDIPVLIDMAWAGIYSNFVLDLNRPSIKVVTLSLGKNWPVESFSLGVRWAKPGWYVPADVNLNMYRWNVEPMIRLMNNFPAHYTINKYKPLQHLWTKRLGLEPKDFLLTSKLPQDIEWFNQHRNLGPNWPQNNIFMGSLYENEELIKKYFKWDEHNAKS